jgi:RNA polymerase sigma factor (sigma-70 family)
VQKLTEASDDALLAACLGGNDAAWAALIDRYAALIYSVPLKYGLSEADAADVFQWVCVTLFEKLDSVRAPRGLAAWLITTTSRQCIAVARRRRAEQAHQAVSGASDAELPDPDLVPEDVLLALERQRVVRVAVARLPANCRKLIEALFRDDSQQTTYQELAEGLGVPMNSLGPTRARCLDRLRRLLLAAGYTP